MKFFQKNKKVVLVDDEPGIRETVSMILEDWGFNVISVSNGRSAVEIIKNKKPDLILLDIGIPEIDGYKVCNIVKQDYQLKKIPVIIFTGHGKTKEVNKAFESGADDYMIKPIDWDRLKEKISKLLDITIR